MQSYSHLSEDERDQDRRFLRGRGAATSLARKDRRRITVGEVVAHLALIMIQPRGAVLC